MEEINSNSSTPSDPQVLPPGRSLAAAIWRFLLHLLVWVIFIFILLNFVFQIPAVQNWAVDRVEKAAEEVTGNRVEIEYFYFAFFDRLTLRNVYVEDQNADTLLEVQEMKVNFNLNPFVLIRKGLVVEGLNLRKAQLNIHRNPGEAKSNLDYIIDRLFPPKTTPKKKSKPFRLELQTVELEDVSFLDDNLAKGKRIVVSLKKGIVHIRKMDLPGKQLFAQLVELSEPDIRIESLARPAQRILTVSKIPDPSDTLFWEIRVGKFQLSNGSFAFHDYRRAPVKTTAADVLDYKHLDVFNIDISIDTFSMQREVFRGGVEKIAFRDKSGFILNELSAKQASVSPEGLILNGCKLITPYSEIGDTLTMRYGQYQNFEDDFNNTVRLGLRLNNASVAIRDIMVFAPQMKSNTFFRSNQDKVLRLTGNFTGVINRLRGDNLNIELSDGSIVKGSFKFNDLTVKNEQQMQLYLTEAKTTVRTLRQLIPKFDPPANFDRLGRLNFSGSFVGFFKDFVAEGLLNTDLGSADMDMRMNLKPGRARAAYSGRIGLTNFDLGKWMGDHKDFGLVNFNANVTDGVGLTAQTAKATLEAEVQSFLFKGYNYKNASLKGQLNRNFFKGDFSIKDDNIDFSFNGEVDLTGKNPEFDFDASVQKLDLKKLNLSQKNMILSGKINLSINPDLVGTAVIRNFTITYDSSGLYRIDSIVAVSSAFQDGSKKFVVNSDVLSANVEGRFELSRLHTAFVNYLIAHFPHLTNILNLSSQKGNTITDQFAFNIDIADSKGLNWLLDPKLGTLRNTSVYGNYNGQADTLNLNVQFPELSYSNFKFEEVFLRFNGKGGFSSLYTEIGNTQIGEKTRLPKLELNSFLKNDTILLGVSYASATSLFWDNFSIDAVMYPVDSLRYEVHFAQSNLFIFERPWSINPGNSFTFGKGYFDTDGLRLSDRDREIRIDKAGNRGLKLGMTNFDLAIIDEYWKYEALDFAGKFEIEAEVQDIFKMRGIKLWVSADTMRINGDDFGELSFDAESPDLKSRLSAFMTLTKDTSQMIVEGLYNLAGPTDRLGEKEMQANYFNFSVEVAGYPLAIAEYFIGSSVSGTTGSIDANLKIYGMPERPNISGRITAKNGAITIDYLKTRYRFERSFITVSNYLFDATGTVLYDKFNNTAKITGGLTHNHLKELGVSATVDTKRFLCLDTEKGDNEVFYGQAVGSGKIRFSGSFKKTDIYVNASVGDSTRIVIPISDESSASELNMIRFVDKQQERAQLEEKKKAMAASKNMAIKGLPSKKASTLNLEMELKVTEAAQIELVFDEQTGDIIRGAGRGNLRILVPREGGFQMYGDYIIERGSYLFTLYNVVNKDFRIKRGGSIVWSGDPFGARIKLEAEYKDLRASVSNLIQEYLLNAPEDLKREAGNATQVALTLMLEGELLHPLISFDISFPALTGQLQTYAENKLRTLKQDQNELNRQVFGLIIAGQFLPTDIALQGSEILYRTMSELLSNQLSLLLTELFSEVIGESKVVSGINFDIAYNQYQSLDLSQGTNVNSGREFQVSITQNFLNDRLSVHLGGNVDFGNNVRITPDNPGGAFLGNDLVIEYVLNTDKTLKLRIYQRLQPDLAGKRLQIGSGLNYRIEFDSFAEFWEKLRRDTGKR
ncbi:MAG: translocation/assembly module TamB domain-containing protein [Saprospiraceae bacterium]|nr:translocation/assembly module TamB domain-containing protein [Saprospiraceae bacterium]MDZ4705174.1 translocation/assembly module TamB domain-containing protein [Saprospiraceae bacterium]